MSATESQHAAVATARHSVHNADSAWLVMVLYGTDAECRLTIRACWSRHPEAWSALNEPDLGGTFPAQFQHACALRGLWFRPRPRQVTGDGRTRSSAIGGLPSASFEVYFQSSFATRIACVTTRYESPASCAIAIAHAAHRLPACRSRTTAPD